MKRQTNLRLLARTNPHFRQRHYWLTMKHCLPMKRLRMWQQMRYLHTILLRALEVVVRA